MPCDTRRTAVGQTVEQREEEIQKAVRGLESRLLGGTVTVAISPDGAIAFNGWQDSDRGRVADVCAYGRLQVQNSFALAQAVAMAEMAAGRQVNQNAVAQGIHSHDGGNTWHAGH